MLSSLKLYKNATQYLKTVNVCSSPQANDIEKLQSRGLDIYAAVLYHERKISDLERLIPTTYPAELSGELCTAISYLLLAMKNYSKALYMAQKVELQSLLVHIILKCVNVLTHEYKKTSSLKNKKKKKYLPFFNLHLLI